MQFLLFLRYNGGNRFPSPGPPGRDDTPATLYGGQYQESGKSGVSYSEKHPDWWEKERKVLM
jgi:hypothetical protein